MISEKINILWLSDIHFQESYSDYKDLIDYIKKFRGIVKVYHEKQPIDYVLISGDLAYSGSEKDYDVFHKMFLKELLKQLNNPRVITIPGNHDINRGTVTTLLQNELVNNKNKSKDLDTYFRDRNIALSDKEKFEEFTNLFKEYSDFAVKELDTGDLELSTNYKNNRLYGYAIDERNKIIFVMINSAWFSFGDITIKEITKIKENKGKDIDWLLNMNAKMAEFGKLVVGQDLLSNENILDTIDKDDCNKYLVVTTMHHPVHWLDWNEFYNEGNAGNTYLHLVNILKKSDILLTGHEHVPDYIKPLRMNDDKTIHFQAGKFLEDKASKGGKNKFQHNRFSIIEINNAENTIYEHRYLYNNSQNNWTETALDFKISKEKAEARGKNSGSVIGKDKISEFDIVKYLNDKVVENEELTQNQSDGSNENYILKRLESEKSIRICIIPLKEQFYKDLLCKFPKDKSDILERHLIDEVCKWIKKEEWTSQKSIIISIIIMDFLVQEDPYNGHTRNEKYGKIVEASDAYFDTFRHNIFARYEKDNFEEWIDFSCLCNVRLTNIVVPSWHFEEYCTKKAN